MPRKVRFDRFYKYDELTEILQDWERSKPDLLSVSSIGQSYESRDIWLTTLTNTKTGPHDEKPALWLEANIHAIEVTGCTAALHLINKLLTGYGKDQKVTRVLDTRPCTSSPGSIPTGPSWLLPIVRDSSARASAPIRDSTSRTACTGKTSMATGGSFRCASQIPTVLGKFTRPRSV